MGIFIGGIKEERENVKEKTMDMERNWTVWSFARSASMYSKLWRVLLSLFAHSIISTFSRSSSIPPINMPIKCALCSSVSSGVNLIALGNIPNPSAESPQCPVFVHSFVDCVHSFYCARLLCCDSFPLSLWWCPSSSICMAVGVHNQHMYLHLISPWCPCLSIHFHDQQSIVHVGWVCVHGLYSKLLLYLFSKMLWVDIWSLTDFFLCSGRTF